MIRINMRTYDKIQSVAGCCNGGQVLCDVVLISAFVASVNENVFTCSLDEESIAILGGVHLDFQHVMREVTLATNTKCTGTLDSLTGTEVPQSSR